jgi:hypothetical protein
MMGREVEQKERDTAGVRWKRELPWVELAKVLDVAIDAAKVTLHDTRHQEQMRRVKRRFGPGKGGGSKGLARHCRRDGPDAVALQHGALTPEIEVLKTLGVRGQCHTSLFVGPTNQVRIQRERRKKLRDRKSAGNLESSIPDAAAQPVCAFSDEDVAGNVDHFQLTPMEELETFELSYKPAEAGRPRGPLPDHIIRNHIIGEIEHLVVTET